MSTSDSGTLSALANLVEETATRQITGSRSSFRNPGCAGHAKLYSLPDRHNGCALAVNRGKLRDEAVYCFSAPVVKSCPVLDTC